MREAYDPARRETKTIRLREMKVNLRKKWRKWYQETRIRIEKGKKRNPRSMAGEARAYPRKNAEVSE